MMALDEIVLAVLDVGLRNLQSVILIIFVGGIVASAKLFRSDKGTDKKLLPVIGAIVLAGGLYIWHCRASIGRDTLWFGSGLIRFMNHTPITERHWR